MTHSQARFMPLKKSLDEQIVLKQAAPTTPAQFAQGPLAQRLLRVEAIERGVAYRRVAKRCVRVQGGSNVVR